MSVTPCIPFRTGRRAPSWAQPAPSGSAVGELIRERLDAEQLKAAGIRPPKRHTGSFWEARDWAWRAGFRGVELYAAAAAALILRREHGEGQVTVEMVRARIGAAG